MADETHTLIQHEADVGHACRQGKALAKKTGFSDTDIAYITTAISEVGFNILNHAKEGEIFLKIVKNKGKLGLQILAQDRGPGISDVTQALTDGYSTKGGLGIGLPGIKRLMDEFEISTETGEGTKVRMTKWQKNPPNL